MNRQQIIAQFLDLLKPFTRKLPPGFQVTDPLSLSTDLNVDSADLVDLVLQIEERFEVEVPDSAITELKTVGQVIDLLEARLVAA